MAGLIVLGILAVALATPAIAQTSRADNGNGAFTNPLFFDEFSDPDMIRPFCARELHGQYSPGG